LTLAQAIRQSGSFSTDQLFDKSTYNSDNHPASNLEVELAETMSVGVDENEDANMEYDEGDGFVAVLLARDCSTEEEQLKAEYEVIEDAMMPTGRSHELVDQWNKLSAGCMEQAFFLSSTSRRDILREEVQ